MSTSAARHPSVRIPSGLFAYASFAIMVGGWVAFAVALIASQQTLDDVWISVRARRWSSKAWSGCSGSRS
jgi:hypothetical protein